MSKKYWLMIGFVLFLAVVFSAILVLRLILEGKIAKRLNELGGIARKDPKIVQVIAGDHQILEMLNNGSKNYPTIQEWFSRHYRQFIDDQLSDPEVKQVFLIGSRYPMAIKIMEEDYDRLATFIKGSKEFRRDIIQNPAYAHYLGKERVDQLLAILNATNPQVKAWEVFQEYKAQKGYAKHLVN